MPKVQCAHCGAAFTPDACRTRYCDGACYHAAQRQRGADTVVARFWAKVQKSQDGCWLWTASTIKGYGQFNTGRVNGQSRTVYAHRYAWTITNGPIADNLQVCHVCDVPLCVNPHHLFLGTVADNLNDARSKGRLVDGAHLIKLSDAAIADIRAHYQPRINGKALAARHGIALGSLLRVIAGTHRVRPLSNVEAVRTVDLAVYELGDAFKSPRQLDQPFQPVLHGRDRRAVSASTVSPQFGQKGF